MRNKLSPRALVYAGCAIFALTTAVAQNVEVRHDSKDSKSVPITQETEKWWSITAEAGYSSKYIFRGTDLTPNSDGIATEEVRFSGKGFTIGVWMAQQIGDAIVPHNTAVGESGGGGLAKPGNFGTVTFDDTAIQKSFREIDAYISYYHSFGCLEVTVGNIAFFIDRRQKDRFDVTFPGAPQFNFSQDYPSIGDETFDRVFIALSTHKIPYVVPSLTYYQTVYNDGNNPGVDILYFDRNDKLGGYLEGKLSASIPIIKDRLDFDPTAIVSYSFDDRSKAINQDTGLIPTAVPLNGWNHAQIGAELVLHLTSHLSVIGFGNYAHHFPAPTGGTEKNMGWGGARVSITF